MSVTVLAGCASAGTQPPVTSPLSRADGEFQSASGTTNGKHWSIRETIAPHWCLTLYVEGVDEAKACDPPSGLAINVMTWSGSGLRAVIGPVTSQVLKATGATVQGDKVTMAFAASREPGYRVAYLVMPATTKIATLRAIDAQGTVVGDLSTKVSQ